MTQQTIAGLVAQARSGQLVSFPTDTVPALATRPEAADKIYAAKGRDLNKPLILMGAEAQDLWPYLRVQVSEFDSWRAIADEYWPGALTLVLPSSDRVPFAMHPKTPKTIGIRVPNCTIAQTILQQTGPLATTSINLSGQPALVDLPSIESAFPQVFVPSSQHWPDSSRNPRPSTVIEWTPQGWILHRQGSVDIRHLLKP